jgi:hypothetical protein
MLWMRLSKPLCGEGLGGQNHCGLAFVFDIP